MADGRCLWLVPGEHVVPFSEPTRRAVYAVDQAFRDGEAAIDRSVRDIDDRLRYPQVPPPPPTVCDHVPCGSADRCPCGWKAWDDV